jgi:uncharacterized membrane protein YcaP (DUF421 family)
MLASIGAWLDGLFGLSLRAEQLGFGQMTALAVFIYIALIVIVRCGKKRALGEATAFDVILVITIGSIAARAVATGGTAFFPARLAVVTLMFMHWMFSAIARDSAVFSNWIKGSSTLLIRNGQLAEPALRRAHMSRDDLDEDLREKGIGSLSEVKEARLERSGKVSVISK